MVSTEMSERSDSADAEELAACVVAVLKGDAAMFRRLYQLSHLRTFKFAVYLCGNRDVAKDLCQEGYLKALDSLGRLKEPRRFQGWMFTIVRNLYMDRHRNQHGQLNLGEADLEELVDAGPVETSSETVSSILGVHKTLAALSPDDRALILMIHLEGYTYREVAETLGVGVDLVRSRAYAARQRFMKKHEE
jgi:RNA polymerase sigma-70 factor (ECF subfamily)